MKNRKFFSKYFKSQKVSVEDTGESYFCVVMLDNYNVYVDQYYDGETFCNIYQNKQCVKFFSGRLIQVLSYCKKYVTHEKELPNS